MSIKGDENMIKLEDNNKANQLYTQIKKIILEKEKNSSYSYESSQYLANRNIEDEIKKQYLNEEGKVTFENINGDLVTAKISRWHQYKRWSRYGIYEVPNFKIEIYIANELIWNLTSFVRDSFNGEYSENEVSSLNFPLSILQEKQITSQESNDEQTIDETKKIKNDDIISQETKILFGEIESLYNKYKTSEKQRQILLAKRDKDIEIATKKIINTYSKELTLNENNIASIKEELNNFDELLIKYSTFNLDLIGKALQQLISITESEEYLYKQVNHTFKKRVHGVMDSWDEDVKTIVNIIIKKNKILDNYESTNQTKSKTDELIETGDALLLSEQDIEVKKEKQITFYTLTDGLIEPKVNFGKFDYIKDFIDNIIQYRFQNNMDKINEKDILNFMKKYILDNKDKILEKQNKKLEQKILKMDIK